MTYFVTGIDTDSGKTLASCILCQALEADYWKPVQCGYPRDTETVNRLAPSVITHSESYLFRMPASPHAAAKAEQKLILPDKIKRPQTHNNLIIEGAGGCLVPLNDTNFVIDLAIQFNAPVILVADLYLGSINHTLLTAQYLKQKHIQVKGIIFNGDSNADSESIILQHTGYKKLLHIHRHDRITLTEIKSYTTILKEKWQHD